MKKVFGLFVFGILASSAFANDICLKPEGCRINTDTGICIECVDFEEFLSHRPPSQSCVEMFTVCSAKIRWPESLGGVSMMGVCKAALNECRIISNVRLRLKWEKKSS